MKSLKWGVIGAGSVAQRRSIPAIQKSEGAELHAILSRDQERGQLLAEQFGAMAAYTDINDLLIDPELDAVYIATPVFLHAEQAIAAAEKGIHVLCDKPLALNPEQSQQIVDACELNQVHLQICFLFRFHSCFQKIRHWLNEKHFGTIVYARMPFMKNAPKSSNDWHINPAKSGGGSIMDLGAHSIDLLRWFLGEATDVSAFCSNVVYDYPVEETGVVMLRFESGAQAVTETSFSAQLSPQILEIYGTDGSVIVYNENGWKIRRTVQDKIEIIDSQFEDLFQLQFEHFFRCVIGKETPIVSGFDGIRNNQIISAAYESAKSNKAINVKNNLQLSHEECKIGTPV